MALLIFLVVLVGTVVWALNQARQWNDDSIQAGVQARVGPIRRDLTLAQRHLDEVARMHANRNTVQLTADPFAMTASCPHCYRVDVHPIDLLTDRTTTRRTCLACHTTWTQT